MGSSPDSSPKLSSQLSLPRPSERGRSSASLPPGAIQPAVLLVGKQDDFARAVVLSLARYGVHVECASPGAAIAAVVVTAPDLVLVTAEDVAEQGRELLARLQERPETSVVPVALIQEDTALDARLRAFRYGAAAVVPRKASPDELAQRIARLAREIPERPDVALGELGEVTLEELLETLGSELRSGILSVGDPDGKGSLRLVLGGGRPMAQLIEDFVQRTRQHVRSAERLRYEFDARAGGTIEWLADGAREASETSLVDLRGLRLVLADDNSARADAVTHELRARGGEVIVCDPNPSDTRLSQIRLADPSALLIGEEHLEGPGYGLVQRMRQDTRLRWASLLVVRWGELWREERTVALERLLSSLGRLTEPEMRLSEQGARLDRFDARLETLGPARTLRSLATCNRGLRVVITNPRLQVELDLAEGVLVGAEARSLEGDSRLLEGSHAVAALLQLSSGRVQVDHVAHPARANLMAAVDMALGLADDEPPPIKPSLPVAPPTAAHEDPHNSLSQHYLPSVPSQPWAESTHALSLSSLSDGSRGHTNGSHLSFSLVTSPRQSSAPPPLDLTPAAPGASLVRPAPPLSSIDQKLRQLLHVGPQGPSFGLVALLGGLVLCQLAWLGLLVGAAVPARASPLTPATDIDAPLAAGHAPQQEDPGIASQPTLQGAEAAPPQGPEGPLEAVPDETPGDASDSPAVLPAQDGSTKTAPTCEALLQDQALREGRQVGLANEEARAAQKSLVAGDVNAALQHYCRAVHYDGTSALAWIALAQVFMLLRDADQALTSVERSLQIAPSNVTAQVILADASALRGDADKARPLWKKAAKLVVSDEKAYAGLAKRDLIDARRLEKSENFAQAERMYRRVALLAPHQAAGPAGLSRALLGLGETEAAKAWARYAVQIEPDSAEAHVSHGDFLKATGQAEAARGAWQKALELAPGHPLATQRLR